MSPQSAVRASLVTLLVTASFADALAAWTHSSTTNLAVSTAALSQTAPQMVADGSGGVIVVWRDARGGVGTDDIYSQHVLSSGALDPAWPATGLVVCNATDVQQAPLVVTDGLGGAIVTWQDFRNLSEWKLYSRHILASGANDPAWPVNGRALAVTGGNQLAHAVMPDGAGGLIVAWEDYRSGTADIYVTHVLASGALDGSWPANGTAVVALASAQTAPSIVPDYTGGAIVAWVDARTSSNTDIYVHHLQSTGAVDPGWPMNGRLAADLSVPLIAPQAVTDAAGGVVVGYSFNTITSAGALAQHVSASGVVDATWPVGGRLIVSGSGNSVLLNGFTPDWTGGAIAIIVELTTGTTYDISAHHVLASGVLDPAMPPTGRALCRATGNQLDSRSVYDGAGGAFIVWRDYRSGATPDIYAQHLLSSGNVDPAYPVDGRPVCIANGDQTTLTIVQDLAGGVVVGWVDTRNGNSDIYAQNITTFGVLGDPKPVMVSVTDLPNDQGSHVRLRWNASQMDVSPYYEIGSYGVWRQVTSAVATEALARGARLFDSEVGGTVERGIYRVMRDAAQTTWWEGVGLAPAHGDPWYTFVAETFRDSTAAGNPLTAFYVDARAATQIGFWDSAPMSGYSVDNLPPAAPASFNGLYGSGTAHLHWNRNVENDLAGYRLYRGTTASFVPGPGNLIASPPDTGYTDPAGAKFVYKLTAIDVNGNQSPVVTLDLTGATGVGDGPVAELSFAVPTPNPAVSFCRLGFTLPHASEVRLAVFDASGRLVRQIASGMRSAGEHAEGWNLRDRNGGAVGAGLYFARLEVGGEIMLTRRIAITR